MLCALQILKRTLKCIPSPLLFLSSCYHIKLLKEPEGEGLRFLKLSENVWVSVMSASVADERREKTE